MKNHVLDGVVIVHPDYMATAAYSASAPLWYGLRRHAGRHALGADVIYEALIERAWNGQTIYIDGSGDIFIPAGLRLGHAPAHQLRLLRHGGPPPRNRRAGCVG